MDTAAYNLGRWVPAARASPQACARRMESPKMFGSQSRCTHPPAMSPKQQRPHQQRVHGVGFGLHHFCVTNVSTAATEQLAAVEQHPASLVWAGLRYNTIPLVVEWMVVVVDHQLVEDHRGSLVAEEDLVRVGFVLKQGP
eukprot:scaffold7215_cov366-Prasinococcus_capsulatus_cf.AAC.17